MLDKRLYLNIDWKLISIVLMPVLFYIGIRFMVTYSTHSLCFFKNLTGYECWGCGITRAFNALFQLKFADAYNYNPRIIIIAPLFLYIWIEMLIKYVNRKHEKCYKE